jgi:hypothetical protein
VLIVFCRQSRRGMTVIGKPPFHELRYRRI